MKTAKELRASLAPYESYPLQYLLQRAAIRMPNKVAVIDGTRRFTYQQLDTYSDRFAAALASIGVTKGDRVGILAPNCVEFVIAFYGIVKAGAVVSTINSGYREREIAHQLRDSGTKVLVVHQALQQIVELARDSAPELKSLIVIKDTSDEAASFWGLIEHAPLTPPPVAIDPKVDLAVLPYSSGTTGLSKGVMLTHFNLTSNVTQLLGRSDEAKSLRDDEVILVHLPLFHIYGMNVLMNGSIAAGATQVMMGRFDMELFLGLIAQHRVSVLFTVPPVGLGLTQYPGLRTDKLASIRMGFFGAAPLSGDLQERLQSAVGFPIVQGYGLTETSPYTNSDFLEPELRKPGSVGPAAPDTEEKVVDLETGTTEVATGEIGELLIRGPQVMQGYYNNPEATAATLTEDGWLHTGDIVRMDSDGYVWVLDRKKELIKYKGFQVPPAELEGILLEHPAIADAAVIGKPDPESGEIPKAFVVCKPGNEVSKEDLMHFVANQVATFKQIREVEFVDAIPKNPTGKLLRRVLIEQERAKAGN
jgi:acyl-CoA synthetase (AMP-forming)/AMP-acid ligase II